MDQEVLLLIDELGRSDMASTQRAAVLARLKEQMQADGQAVLPQDNTIRNMAATEAFRNARADRDRQIAKREMNNDEAFVNDLRQTNEVLHGKVAQLIASVARFAGELQHNLIHPSLRDEWKKCDLAARPQLLRSQRSWHDLVDPGLAGNTHLVCRNIETAFATRLQGLKPEHIINGAPSNNDPQVVYLLSAAVAARWRANAVFNANTYKTGNQQVAVEQALREAIRAFSNYRLVSGVLLYQPPAPPPSSLQEHILLTSGTYAT